MIELRENFSDYNIGDYVFVFYNPDHPDFKEKEEGI